MAWISTACQFALILLGVLLVLKEAPPAVSPALLALALLMIEFWPGRTRDQ